MPRYIVVNRDTGARSDFAVYMAAPREFAPTDAWIALASSDIVSGGVVMRRCTNCATTFYLTPGNFRWRRSFRPTPRFGTRCLSCERRLNRERRANHSPRASATATASAVAGNRRFGIEFEINCNRSTLQRELDSRALRGWRIKADMSLGANGLELVSPPLRGEDGFAQVRIACEAMAAAGADVDRRCGLHVHVDADGLSAVHVRNIVATYTNANSIIDGLLAPSRGAGRNTYCNRWSASAVAHLASEDNLHELVELQDSRYMNVNLHAYPRFGTIEFRQHQGTISYRKTESWIKFLMAIVSTSARAIGSPVSVAALMTAAQVDEDTAAFLIGRAVQFGRAPISAPAAPTAAAVANTEVSF